MEDERVEEGQRRYDVEGGKCAERRKQRLVVATSSLYTLMRRV